MSRHRRPLTEAEAQRLQSVARGERPVAVAKGSTHRQYGEKPHATVHNGVQPTETGYLITYSGWLPKLSNHYVHWRGRAQLSKLTRQVFGMLPSSLCQPRRTKVEVIRVLGPRQKPMDRDSIAQMVAGLIDGLQPVYIFNDSEKWSDVTYRNDETRRQDGPFIEVKLTYEAIS